MDMSNYRELFLSETREHINNLNDLIVSLEKEPGNRETIDAMFREAHSVKGMAATMGYDHTARLAHHLEDLMDGFRSTGEVPPATIDYLFEGIDLLDGLLDDLQAARQERETEPFLSKQPGENTTAPEGAIVTEETPQREEPLTAIVLEPIESDDDVSTEQEESAQLDTPEETGVPEEQVVEEEPVIFQVLVDLAEGTPASAARGMLILRELEKSGELKSSKPDLSTLREGAPCLQVQAWVCTSLNKEHIEEALLQISGVTKVRFIDDRRQEDRRQSDEVVRTVRVRTDLLDQFVNLTGELITQRYMLNDASDGRNWEQLEKALGQTGRLIEDLHHNVLQARLMPLENITGRLPRIVRDLSKKTGKKVVLQLTGMDVGIDRVILEELTDPLVHLVRNAVDHGIEEEGTVTVSARREKDLVLVEVADDGKGMSPDQLRQKALAKNLITQAQADNMQDRDALMLVCQPGFSTTEEVTETSGRGVGMDVVKEAVNNLGGTLDIVSSPGEGTRFEMRLPLSVAIIKILMVSCGGHPLAIPITRVQRNLDLPSQDIDVNGSQRTFILDEEEIRLYRLTAALGLPDVPAGETTWVILTEIQGRRVGLEVDCFLGQRDAFVKQIGYPLNLLSGLSGATVEGTGRVVFILDPQALFEQQALNMNDQPGRH